MIQKCLEPGFFTEGFGPHQTNVVGLPFEPPEGLDVGFLCVFFRLVEEKSFFLIEDARNLA